MDLPDHRLTLLGRIVRLKIQHAALKLGEKPHRVYDPAPLRAVDALTLTPQGALARADDGSMVLDIHHAAHPATRHNGGDNGLSVGFTGHYDAMRARFGPHLLDGLAGESILVAAAGQVPLAAVAGGLVVRRAATGAQVALGAVRVALPCVEFSRFALRSDGADEVKAALQFLDYGMRGFYCTYAGDPITIDVGDELLAAG